MTPKAAGWKVRDKCDRIPSQVAHRGQKAVMRTSLLRGCLMGMPYKNLEGRERSSPSHSLGTQEVVKRCPMSDIVFQSNPIYCLLLTPLSL